MSSQGDFAPFLELDHLRIMAAQPEYLLAMKCSAMRIGPEFHDEDDIRYLLRLLEIHAYEKAVATITKYYPLDRFPQKNTVRTGGIIAETGLRLAQTAN
jgi:hypothetical protein